MRATARNEEAQLTTAELIERIVTTHHAYVRRELPYLQPLAAKVARVHGAKDKRLALVNELVDELQRVLPPHLDSEEGMLFPELLREPDGAGARLAASHADHKYVTALLDRLGELTNRFVVPAGACTSWTNLWNGLAAFEADTREHLRLENEVLLPRFRR